MPGQIEHTFNATGVSPQGSTSRNKTMELKGSDAFVVDAEISRDLGQSFSIVKSFNAATVENFEWLGSDAIVRFNCTTFDTLPVTVVFK